MGILDFIRNRQSSQQQTSEKTQEQSPSTAKEMYARQEAQEKKSQPAVEQISDQDKASAREAAERIKRVTERLEKVSPSHSAAPSEGTASPQPMRQKMMQQENAAPALSPTTAQAGATAKDATRPSNESAGKTTEQSEQRTRQTLPRRPPSWER